MVFVYDISICTCLLLYINGRKIVIGSKLACWLISLNKLCIGAVAKNSTILCGLWNWTAILYPQIMTKPRRKKIWDAIFLFRTTTPLNTTLKKKSHYHGGRGGGAEEENKTLDFFPFRFRHDLRIEKCSLIPEMI